MRLKEKDFEDMFPKKKGIVKDLLFIQEEVTKICATLLIVLLLDHIKGACKRYHYRDYDGLAFHSCCKSLAYPSNVNKGKVKV